MTLRQIPVFSETRAAPSGHAYQCPHTRRYHMFVLILKPFHSYLNCFRNRGCIGSEGDHVNAVICIGMSVCMSI